MAKIIKNIIPIILKPALAKRNLAQAMVVVDWDKIVGASIAQYTRPERITYYKKAASKGTLVLAVTPGWAPVVEHAKQQIIERINSYCGYEAISRLQLQQTLYKTGGAPAAAEPTAEESPSVETLVGIDNKELECALLNLKASLSTIKKNAL